MAGLDELQIMYAPPRKRVYYFLFKRKLRIALWDKQNFH